MAEHLNEEEKQLLKSALSTAFAAEGLPHQAVPIASATQDIPSAPSTEEVPQASASSGESVEEEWKAEYEAHLSEWRQRSAEQRRHAEAERARWEAIRQRERELREAEGGAGAGAADNGWETVSGSGTAAASASALSSPSPADARDLVTGEAQGTHAREYLERVLPGHEPSTHIPLSPLHERAAHAAAHDKWEELTHPPSVASSYPSYSYPTRTHTPPSHPAPPSHTPSPAAAGAGSGATHAVLDHTLSPRTRALALLSSVAINVLLPFVNGVMLGFGEIFAKDVLVKWLGWKPAPRPGDIAARVGLGKKRGEK